MAHLLLVEDDDLLRDGVSEVLTQAGHVVETVGDGLAAQALLAQHGYDALLLDLGLPRLDGMGLLHWTRQRFEELPVMILTARAGVDSRVEGLQAGADDYLTKPFDNAELTARVQALLRRARLPAVHTAETASADAQTASGLRVDADIPRAWVHDQAIDLTQREWALLRLLHAHFNQVVSREAVAATWQHDAGEAASSNALEVYIHRLRRKLQDSGLSIRNIRGLGYMMERT